MIPITKALLGTDVVAAIANAKRCFQNNTLREFDGRELLNSYVGRAGAKLLEAPVGGARSGDLAGASGRRRLVLLIQSQRITEMYFSDNHYRVGSWRRIIDVV